MFNYNRTVNVFNFLGNTGIMDLAPFPFTAPPGKKTVSFQGREGGAGKVGLHPSLGGYSSYVSFSSILRTYYLFDSSANTRGVLDERKLGYLLLRSPLKRKKVPKTRPDNPRPT